jgi:hypothetical protein
MQGVLMGLLGGGQQGGMGMAAQGTGTMGEWLGLPAVRSRFALPRGHGAAHDDAPASCASRPVLPCATCCACSAARVSRDSMLVGLWPSGKAVLQDERSHQSATLAGRP